MNGSIPQRQSGLTALLAEHRGGLLRFLTARTGDAAVAEDLLQELWIKVHQADPVGIEHGRAYLFKIANNLVLDRARGERRRVVRERAWSALAFGPDTGDGDVADPRLDAEHEMIERERVAAIASAIANLPPAAGRVFRMHKLEGISHADIARQLGISRSGVEKHIATAMAHLRRATRD
jgi:RNA polymerase sigma factor (sigma-70 family)